MRNLIMVGTIAALAQILPAHANSTTTYTYDALGRLVATSNTGTSNNGLSTNIEYDSAGNRKTYQVSGAASRVIVVPLNGFTVIKIQN